MYQMKHTYISTALTAGVNPVWLETQTGVRYETLRRHYGKWLWAEGADQLRKISELAPELDQAAGRVLQPVEITGDKKWTRGESNRLWRVLTGRMRIAIPMICDLR
jgi:hypothetical protein